MKYMPVRSSNGTFTHEMIGGAPDMCVECGHVPTVRHIYVDMPELSQKPMAVCAACCESYLALAHLTEMVGA